MVNPFVVKIVNKKIFVRNYVTLCKNQDYKITQNKLNKNLKELRTKVSKIIYFSNNTFKVLTKPIICEEVDFGQFLLYFQPNNPTKIFCEGGKLNFTYDQRTPDFACHMNIYQKDGIGIGNKRRVCLSETIEMAINNFYNIQDLSGVVSVVLNMFANNVLTDGLGQHGWFHINLKRCTICDARTNLVNDLCPQCLELKRDNVPDLITE